MGFLRDQEIRLAMRFLSWQYQKTNKPIPHEVELKKQAAVIVDDAHRIARQRGQNVVSILKEMISDIKR